MENPSPYNDREDLGDWSVTHFVPTQEHRELHDVAGEPVAFEWRIHPGHTTAQPLGEVQRMLDDTNKVHPLHFKGRSIFMSMYNDIDWNQKRNDVDTCSQSSSRAAAHAKQFPTGCWTFLGPGDEGKWYGALSHRLEGKVYKAAEVMKKESAESGHPVLRC